MSPVDSATPAGWFDDGHGQMRWWDGQRWTEHLQAESGGARPRSGTGEPLTTFNDLKAHTSRSLGGWLGGKAAARQATKERLASQKLAAGPVATRGTFGDALIELYQGGYVRVAHPGERSTDAVITNKTPYEKLVDIVFISPDESTGEAMQPVPTEAVTGAASLVKGVTRLAGMTLPGAIVTAAAPLALAGAKQISKAITGRAVLTITTETMIHSLTNQTKGRLGARREQESTGRALEQIGRRIIGLPERHAHQAVQAAIGPTHLELDAATSTHPISPHDRGEPTMPAVDPVQRLRDLNQLRDDGIIDDDEFNIAKAMILRSM
ncbi:MAG: DUF2510 domain-containing protein [Propionibacteriaceae bacterium]|jgi:hypothetical protein|nr:DUF2510 domain-containing protein [Propionibacteriaceae bacterium]